ncbi:DNA topoisomerase 2-binding protein 1-A-like isoform X1 [Vespa mandarinia]|uniref:DNA topoisomerase 2-binding protein 1-A-like isoform X1 n=1 Tax=Vespa mandarinia TaxID=7446 RepID=UPI00161288E0|nr:DNA topoisomerase 2-binding protein 1-A-like isoform X1 [Vespa mandarinia]XP_035738545.1 DNA topoisomerase 2-binding protein 1-A-like isoform X1 [Vespa mandarinia]
MVSQESQIDCNINVYFVIPNKYKSENECSINMWNAFDKCCDFDIKPVWITEEDCGKLKPDKTDIFVLEEFKGIFFQQLQNFKCSRIVGPKCLLTCFLNGEPIPEGASPIYTTAMRGLCISVSGLTPEMKNHVQQLVEYMGAFFTKQLRNCVTHLVTNSVMSAKYERAVELKIPIVTKDWVAAIWEENLNNFIKADDPIFDKYKCPVFMNLIVTSTNLSKRQKEEIKNLINNNGGTFMGPLDGLKVKIVVAPENSSLTDKLKFAMQNNIACLKPEWVYESLKLGYALPFNNYLIKSTKACSTPEKSKAHEMESLNFSAISTITSELPQNNYVDESVASTITNASCMDIAATKIGAQLAILDRLNLKEAKMAGPFLDGCNIYLAGFTTNQRDKLNRILNVGSATRLNDISDALTHIIIGDESKASNELKLIKSAGLCPYMLNVNWIEESMKLKRPAPEEQFLYESKGFDTTTKTSNEPPPSPLSKKNLQMLQPPKRPPVPRFDIDKASKETNEENILNQYLQNIVVEDKSVKEFLKPYTSDINEKGQEISKENTTKLSNNRRAPMSEIIENRESGNNSSVPFSQEDPECTVKIFTGFTFVITGFDDDDVHDSITALGGEVVSNVYSGIPDFAIVPTCGASLRHAVNEIVTDLFVEDCRNQEQIVDIEYYHKPFSISKDINPLTGCIVTLSMYTGVERIYLSRLAEELGALCQDILARKTNNEKNTYASTHLVCPTPEGNKYKAAVKWNLPAVTAEWLKDCGTRVKRLDETPYLVGETMAPERSPEAANVTGTKENSLAKEENREKPTASIPRQIITPKRQLSQVKNQETNLDGTPLINKRLGLVMNSTPPFPFHVSTPETPYGQVIKPNPSPDTRKAWIKWVNDFPDLRVEEPPLKRRAPSTPLSDLKKQLWEQLKMQGQRTKEEENMSTLSTFEKVNNDLPEEDKSVEQNKDTPPKNASINRKLNFSQQSISPNVQINLQIAQLEQALKRTSSAEGRSLPDENGKPYENTEPLDNMCKYIAKDSQPDTVGWEDPDHRTLIRPSTIYDESNENEDTRNNDYTNQDITLEDRDDRSQPLIKRKFMLSGIRDRATYEEVIRNLGGDVVNDGSFDPSATHLMCLRPSRNEKMLGSIAAGKWVLHCMYLRDSEANGNFLDEEKYEWGNPKSKGIIPDPTGEIENAIAAAAHRWRIKLLKEPYGPFHDMVALLLASEEKYDQFKRLIEAGGGTVVQARPPYDVNPSGKKITHCFVNVKQIQQPIDWARLASKGILCFLPQYLSDLLTAEPALNPRDCVLPEFKKYLSLLPK